MICCQKCKSIPLLTLINPQLIYIKCKCNFEKKIMIEDFISYYNINNNFKVSFEKLKEKNDINNSTYFCKFCTEHYTSEKKEIHKAHESVKVSEILNIQNLEKFLQLYNSAKSHLNNYNKQLLNKIINLLQEKITIIQKAFLSNKFKNENLIKFYEILLDNYFNKPNNFFVINNLINNSLFNISEYYYSKNEENITDQFYNILSYFKNDYVLGIPKVDLYNNLKEIAKAKHHTESICSILFLKDGRLATSSCDCSINVINITTLQVEISIPSAHNSSIFYISQLHNQNVITCSSDRTIKIWEISESKYKNLATILGNSSSILKVIPITKDRFASCFEFGNIKIWSSNPPYRELIELHDKHTSLTSIIQLKQNGQLVSCSSQKKINFWNLDKYQLVHSIKGISCVWRNGMVEVSNNKIVVGGACHLSIINSKTYQIEAIIKIEGNDRVFSIFELRDKTILCGLGKGFYQLSMLNYTKVFQKEMAHEHNILSLCPVDNFSFFSSSFDTFIKKWKY